MESGEGLLGWELQPNHAVLGVASWGKSNRYVGSETANPLQIKPSFPNRSSGLIQCTLSRTFIAPLHHSLAFNIERGLVVYHIQTLFLGPNA
jgi:hypothetical protein